VRIFVQATLRLGDPNEVHQLQGACISLLIADFLMQTQGLAQLTPDLEHGIQAGHRLLKDHRNRIAANGDTANKIGTYLKALAARAHGVPFYVAAPLSTVDYSSPAGHAIPIEERAPAELGAGNVPAINPAFDITPAHLITGIISERGVTTPEELAQWKT